MTEIRKYREAEEVRTDALIPYERNAKVHDEKQIKNVAQSIRQFGFVQPLVIDRDNVVVIGHCRLLAAKRLGLETVPCIKAEDLTDEEIRRLRIIDNKVNESPWDAEILEADLDGVDFTGYDIDIEPPEEGLEEITAEEDNWEPELLPETEIQPGEIWMLGEHRLLCGDSTDPENLRRIMGGATADLLLTDPPYNVSLGTSGGHPEHPSEAKARKRRTDGKVIENDSFTNEAEFQEFISRFSAAADGAMKPGAAFYIWLASSQMNTVIAGIGENGWQVRQELIWVKDQMVLGRQDYQWIHEPCLYGWKGGAGHYFAPTRREYTVFEDQIDPAKMSKAEMRKFIEDLLQEDGGIPRSILHEERPKRSEQHPTMKPVKLMARLIRNSSKEGEIVLDPFGGSGSTLIACEQMHRRCFTIELDKQYAQSIIDRWESFTGEKAERLS